MLLVLIAVIYFLYLVRRVLLPFILAVVIVYLIEPFIDWLVNRGLKRSWALILIFLLVSGGVLLTSLLIAPLLVEELNALAGRLPQYVSKIQSFIEDLNQSYERIALPPTIKSVFDNMINRIEMVTLRFVERTTEVILLSLSRILSLVLAPILAFYILKDIESIKDSLWSLIPKKQRQETKTLLKKIDRVLLDYLKGQLLVSALIGLLSVLGLYFLRIRFNIIIGIFAGIMNIIPYLGPIMGTIPAVIIASFDSFKLVIAVVVFFVLIQQLESSLISPKIVGDRVGLHPTLIIFSLLAGGELLGVIGMFVAVPIGAVVKVLIDHLISRLV
ncbi:AI-2E family transporter [Fuchsiella alkaliacetigena]|uniref:AI-2E family transporter n=1 Tax=Fuchsiella alkaliacetigena TaxID=957042 RepID=UPI00200B6C76|nr:AI-2E family transporter [Fuchsiella alkaliacetigena]